MEKLPLELYNKTLLCSAKIVDNNFEANLNNFKYSSDRNVAYDYIIAELNKKKYISVSAYRNAVEMFTVSVEKNNHNNYLATFIYIDTSLDKKDTSLRDALYDFYDEYFNVIYAELYNKYIDEFKNIITSENTVATTTLNNNIKTLMHMLDKNT